MDEINALVDEKIEADTDFQASLAELTDEDRDAAVAAKRTEVLSGEFASLKEKADKAAKAEEVAGNYKTRAEKAEAEAKKLKEAGGGAGGDTQPTKGLSAADIVALSKVDEEDIERVEKFAADSGLSIKEALKDDELKAILGLRAEKRASASAANTGPVRRGSAAVSDDALLAKANRGEDLSSEELDKVMTIKARQR